MQERRECEFFLVRYVPDPVKNEFVNIGVVLRESLPGVERSWSGGSTRVQFTRNWRRVRCLDPDADTAMLEALEAEIRQRMAANANGVKPLIPLLEDSLSNLIQFSPVRGCLAENLTTEIEQLLRLYVEPQKREAIPRRSVRQSIHGLMQREFERGGVLAFMEKQIPVTRFIETPDTLRIDFAYRNGGLRMFQAMPLHEIDSAKVLAFTAEALREGVSRRMGMELELTAIVDPLTRDADGAVERSKDEEKLYHAGKDILEHADILVLTTSALPGLVARAREELGL